MQAEAGGGISPLLDRLPVLFPEEQEGDALVALELPMDLVPVRFDLGRGCRSFLLLQNLGQKCLRTRFRQGTENEFDAEGTCYSSSPKDVCRELWYKYGTLTRWVAYSP